MRRTAALLIAWLMGFALGWGVGFSAQEEASGQPTVAASAGPKRPFSGVGGQYTCKHLDKAIPGDVYMGRVELGPNRKTGALLYNPTLGLDGPVKGPSFYFPLVTVAGKKVTVGVTTLGGQVIDEAVLRDAQDQNVAPVVAGPALSPTIRGLLERGEQ